MDEGERGRPPSGWYRSIRPVSERRPPSSSDQSSGSGDNLRNMTDPGMALCEGRGGDIHTHTRKPTYTHLRIPHCHAQTYTSTTAVLHPPVLISTHRPAIHNLCSRPLLQNAGIHHLRHGDALSAGSGQLLRDRELHGPYLPMCSGEGLPPRPRHPFPPIRCETDRIATTKVCATIRSDHISQQSLISAGKF